MSSGRGNVDETEYKKVRSSRHRVTYSRFYANGRITSACTRCCLYRRSWRETERYAVQDRQIPVTHFQDNTGTRKTSTGRTLKRTKNGNPYIYEDKYNHNGDIKFSRAEEEHYDLRMPKGQKAQFMQIAKQQKMSFNQMVLRAIEMYIQNTVR